MEHLLEVARGFLELVAPRACPGCALPTAGGVGFCAACEPLLERSDEPDAVYVFGGPLARAVAALKYEGRTDHVPALSALFQPALDAFVGRIDAVVPIPLHRRRHRERGFNQSCLLASRVARVLGVPLDVSLLVRVRDTGTQVGRDADARGVKLRGAFRAAPRARDRRILLIDDVRTTGATFEAAIDALADVGARSIDPLALAAAEG